MGNWLPEGVLLHRLSGQRVASEGALTLPRVLLRRQVGKGLPERELLFRLGCSYVA